MSNIISYQSLKLRLYPNTEQTIYLNKCFGATRFVYNYFLAERNKFYENVIVALRKDFDYYKYIEKLATLQNKEVKSKEDKLEIKNLQNLIEKIRKITNEEYKNYKELKLSELKEKFPFLKEVNAQGICNSYLNLKQVFSDFYSGKSEKPKFHSKKIHNSFKDSMMKQDFFDWNSKTINLPKIGKIKFRNRNLPKWFKSKIKVCSYTCSKNSSGSYYISIIFEVRFSEIKKSTSNSIDENQIIGLDFDCDDMYIDSKGKSAKDYGFKKQKQENLKKLSHLQRQFTSKVKNSKNREKARIKLAKFEEKIANKRKDWIEKESLRLVKRYRLIGVENLSIQGMMKGSRNAKNYQDIVWGTFVSKLEWKSKSYDCRVMKISKFFASSQICNVCGFKNKDVQIRHLENYICPECGTKHQRDENAAKNIAAESYKVLREAEENLEKTSTESRTC